MVGESGKRKQQNLPLAASAVSAWEVPLSEGGANSTAKTPHNETVPNTVKPRVNTIDIRDH